MDCSLPGSSVHGIFQARVLEWGAIAFSFLCLGTQKYKNPSLKTATLGAWTFLSPRRRRLSSALSSGQSFMNPHPRAVEEGAGPSALSAKVENSDEVCVLVSEQFHVEHLRVRVCCVLDL